MAETIRDQLAEEAQEAQGAAVTQAQAPEAQEGGKSVWEWLKTPTAEGPIESYTDHPLNYDRTASTGRILRGLEGFLGDLRLAVVDVVAGLLEKFWPTKRAAESLHYPPGVRGAGGVASYVGDRED